MEDRERELLRNQGSMQEALSQLGARAEAAEQKLQTRVQELQAEHEELAALLRTNAAASLEVQLSASACVMAPTRSMSTCVGGIALTVMCLE